jgi:hypothetical protein
LIHIFLIVSDSQITQERTSAKPPAMIPVMLAQGKSAWKEPAKLKGIIDQSTPHPNVLNP